MKKLLALTAALLLTAAGLRAQCGIDNTAFQSGETLRYDLYFNWQFVWMKVGTASMNITAGQYQGKSGYRAYLITRGSKSADRYFVMRDTLVAQVDQDLNPLYYSKRALEGDSYRVDETYYTYAGGKSKVKQRHQNKHGQSTWSEAESSICIYDMLSMLLRARSFDATRYQKGSRIAFMMADGKSCERREIIFKGKDTFKVQNTNTEYRCLVFSYVEKEDGKEKTIVTFYITDDANHIPVRLDMNLKFGTAKAYLSGMTGIRNAITSRVK